MGLKAMSRCSRTRLCAVFILIFLLKPPSVSCSRLIPRASVFHLFSSFYQKHKTLLNPSSSRSQSVPVQHPYTPSLEVHGQPQVSPSSRNVDNTKDQGLDPELQRHSNLETTGDCSKKGFRRPPSFQMLPRNSQPPPRGPSPGSNRLGDP